MFLPCLNFPALIEDPIIFSKHPEEKSICLEHCQQMTVGMCKELLSLVKNINNSRDYQVYELLGVFHYQIFRN